MSITFAKKDTTIGLVTISGPLTAANVDFLREQFVRWHKTEQGIKHVILDLADVDIMDSAGLGMLMAVLKKVREHDGNLKIACLGRKPRMVFEITHAFKIFDCFESVELAINACS